MMRLSKKQALMLHKRLIEATGGREGIRDEEQMDYCTSAIIHLLYIH